MANVLEQAVEANEIVKALKTYGITQAEVGAVTGVSARAVREWGRSTIRHERYDRLAELRDIVLILSDSLSPRGIGQWFHARNRLLLGERPLDLFEEGRVSDVRRAAEAFVEGSYV